MDTLERTPQAAGARPQRPWLRLIGVVCVVALLAAGGWYVWARAHTGPQPYGGPETANDMLRQVTLDSAGGVWAVGTRYTSLTSHTALTDSFILHYQRQSGQWVVSEMLAATGGDFITAIAMVSPTEGWAVGGEGATNALILHYQHGQWSALPEHPRGQLDAIAMVAPDEGWAVGTDVGGGSIMLRYSHGAWSPVSVPQVGALDTIAMYSADSGWAAGGGILRYANGAWTQAAFTPPLGAPISDIVAPAPDEAWAAGATIYHYQFGKWSAASVPSNASISGIAMDSSTSGWAVGDPVGTATSVLWRYENGAWTAVNSPTRQPLLSVASVSPREVWAVGVRGVVLRCGGDSCSLVNGPA